MDSRLLGAYGEQCAARYLRDNGYKILSADYKTYVGEIDLVAQKKKTVCFVEVKTRTEGAMLPPSSAVGLKKRENIKASASIYMNLSKLKCEKRFDIIEVITDENNKMISLKHIENAFS